jgi:hypothetical protein
MRLALFTALLALLPATAFAQDSPPSCPVADGTAKTEDLQALPTPVAHSLQRHVPNLSPPGSLFNGGDVFLPGQSMLSRRLIAAFHRGNRWVVAYEAAGRGYHHVVVAYDLSQDGKTSAIAFKVQSFPASLCATVDRAFNSNGPVDRYW